MYLEVYITFDLISNTTFEGNMYIPINIFTYTSREQTLSPVISFKKF